MQGNTGDILDEFKAGQIVTCQIVIKGAKWSKNGNESVFNTLLCTSIKRFPVESKKLSK